MAAAMYASTSTNSTWATWCTITTSSATSTTAASWDYWRDEVTTTTSTGGSDTIWVQWTDGTGAFVRSAPRQQTPEERAEEEARQARWREIAEQERKAKEAAEARAEKLLLENLSLKQRAEYEQHKHFVIERGDRRYRVRRGRTGNVDVIDKDGRVSHRLCAHPAPSIPDPDTMLAQKLMLEHDDEAFLRVANRHEAYDRAQVLPAMH
jgi:hypothetical protein